MARTYEISFKLGAQIAGNFAKTMTSASGALSQLNSKISEIGSEQKSIKKLLDLRETVRNTHTELLQARNRVQQLSQVMQAIPSAETAKKLAQSEKAADKLQQKFESKKQTLLAMNREMKATTTTTAALVSRQQQLAASAEKAEAAQRKLHSALEAQQANMANRANLRGQMLDAAALAVSLAAPIKAAIKFESVMADVNKVVDQTAAQSKEMGTAIVGMSREIPLAAEGLAKIVAAGGQAGIAREDLLLFAESAAKMGVAFDVTADQAGDMMATWRTAFGLGQKQVTALADQINYLSNTSAASAPKIADVVTRVGGLGKLAGLNSGQVAALGGALVAVGAPSEVAATGMQNMMLALTAGASATKKQSEAFQALGFDAEQLAVMMQQDAQGAILSVLNAVNKLGAEQRPAVLTEIFGKESIKSVGQLVNNTELLAKNFKAVGDASVYSGSMQKEFASRSATTENNIQLLMNRVTALGISLGNILLPGVNAVLGVIGPFVDMVADLANRFPVLTSVMVGGVAALMALKVVTIASAYAFTFLKGAWLSGVVAVNTLRVAMLLATGATVAQTNATKTAIVMSKAITAAQWLWNAALSANPIGLVIAAVAALIAAGVALYHNWDKVTAFFSAAWARMKELFLTFHPLGWMIGGFDRLHNFLSQFSLYNSGVKLLSTLAAGIKSAVSKPVQAVKNALAKVREYLPFSDAKVGPLSELTASGQAILNTIGAGMKQAGEAPLVKPFTNTATGMMASVNATGSTGGGLGDALPPRSANNNGLSIQITQQITVQGGGDTYAQAKAGAADGAQELIQKLQAAMGRERRLSYG